MGTDNNTRYVEVVVTKREWRKSYGISNSDLLENVELGVGEYTTGQVRYGWEVDENNNE